MSEGQYDEALAAYLDSPTRSLPEGSVSQLTDRERRELEALLDVAETLWDVSHGAPPLEEDPVAAMLGLVPDRRSALNPKALTRLRKLAGLKIGQLADRLNARGWEVKAPDVFRWETKSAIDVSPALVAAIAEEIGAAAAQITTDLTGEHEEAGELRRNPRFKELATKWAELRNLSSELAESALYSRALATVHRGQHPDTEQMLASLEALVKTLEGKPDSQ
jgi:hypothetical protein